MQGSLIHLQIVFNRSSLMSRRNSVFRRSVDILSAEEGYSLENATRVVNRDLEINAGEGCVSSETYSLQLENFFVNLGLNV